MQGMRFIIQLLCNREPSGCLMFFCSSRAYYSYLSHNLLFYILPASSDMLTIQSIRSSFLAEQGRTNGFALTLPLQSLEDRATLCSRSDSRSLTGEKGTLTMEDLKQTSFSFLLWAKSEARECIRDSLRSLNSIISALSKLL